jgi:hypothetical protein
MKKLLIISGADRVGKSTFCQKLNHNVFHFSAPKDEDSHIFKMYKDVLDKNEKEKCLIFDRSYVCAYILEEFRRHSTNHILDIFEFEMKLMREGWDIKHIGLSRPWNWVAKYHLKELIEENPKIADWRLRDMLYERNQEHLAYEKLMRTFFNEVTIFSAHVYTDHLQAFYDASLWIS